MGKSEEGNVVRKHIVRKNKKIEREKHKAEYDCIVRISFEGNESWKEKRKIQEQNDEGLE